MNYYLISKPDNTTEIIGEEKIVKMVKTGELSRFQEKRLRQALKKADKIWGSEKKKVQNMSLW